MKEDTNKLFILLISKKANPESGFNSTHHTGLTASGGRRITSGYYHTSASVFNTKKSTNINKS